MTLECASWGGITILEEGRSHALSVYIHELHSQWTHISQVSFSTADLQAGK